MSTDIKQNIANAISSFSKGNLFDNSIKLFSSLGYKTERQSRLSKSNYKSFSEEFSASSKMNLKNALVEQWEKIELLFQLTQSEMTRQSFLFDTGKVDNTIIEAYLFFAIELKSRKEEYKRKELSDITRELNKVFSMPVMILFRYENNLTLSVIKRRLHKRDDSKDVLEKVTLIKDINIESPHRAHIEILYDLSFDKLLSDFEFKSFVELHNAWQKTLDSSELNKRFYKELANWYFWAVDNVEFPDDVEKDEEKRNSINVIRMLTRLIFVWFLKEKDNLIPDELFNKKKLDRILDYKDKTGSTYYKAILQNLFFATLNTEMNKDVTDNRTFVKRQYGIQEFYRYERFFKDKEAALKLFENIPFLNGGLFENLDKNVGEANEQRIDCFSNNRKNEDRLSVPDFLFFEIEKSYDKLNKVYDTTGKKYVVRGLLEILNKYKFTIHENTPIEEEIALDPELLGKVFENLLASYNEETKTTARKLTGSFYTPREVVNYMVDESLIAYLKNALTEKGSNDVEEKLRNLFSYTENEPDFTDKEKNILVQAIDNCKIVDPACGSGAFPMGILHKMVFILGKLDPHNERWKQRQIDKVYDIPDTTLHDNLKAEIEKAFSENFNDYGRKLYLIENCIYGVDIQPIAVQIAKLRFFISLIVDQKVNRKAKNLGIRPLPNLETKFVAANTLIGIERPHQLSLRNDQIDVKEKKLRDVRERHFNARTPATKKKYREKDKELRKELADLLEHDGFNPQTTKLMASWDPYDQNKFAGFFDSEWMFGLQKGFDVVIGNPPYVQMQRDGGKLAKELKDYNYVTYERTGDVYAIFYECGLKISKEKGIETFITSSQWMKANYGKSLRKFFLSKNPLKLIVLGPGVFESATVDTNIIIISNEKNKKQLQGSVVTKAEQLVDLNNLALQPMPYVGEDAWTVMNSDKQSLSEKIKAIAKPLREWRIKINFGIKTGYNEAFIIDEEKREELIGEDASSADIIKPVLRGREIAKYFTEWDGGYLINTHNGMKNKSIPPVPVKKYPAIKKHLDQFSEKIKSRLDQGVTPYNLRNCAYLEEFSREKIIWKRIGSQLRFSYSKKEIYCLDSTCIATGEKIKYLTALLNSKVCNYLLFENAPKTGMGDLIISVQALEPLYVVYPNDEQEYAINLVTDCILFCIKKGKEYSLFENLIDAMVYELYFPESVKKENAVVIDLVKKQIPDFSEIKGEEEKLKVIEKIYKKLNESNNEIRNRIIKQNIAVEEVKLINQSLSKHAPAQTEDIEL